MNINYDTCIEYIYPDIKKDQYSLRDKGQGVYIQNWTYPKEKPAIDQLIAVNKKATHQVYLKNIRLERNQRLLACDWTQLPESTVKEEWKTYRQALRDFPATCDPENPIWPIEPNRIIQKSKDKLTGKQAEEAERVTERNLRAQRDQKILDAYYTYQKFHPEALLSDYLDMMENFCMNSATKRSSKKKRPLQTRVR